MEQALRPRVLIVDDDSRIRRALHTLLEDYGVEVVGEADNGLQGVQMALALLPDAVLMDVRMPVLGGIDATVQLTDTIPSVRVVMCTVYTDPALCQQALAAGAVAVVAKGDHPRVLLGALQQVWIQVLDDRARQVVRS